jgi:hypothetical protein
MAPKPLDAPHNFRFMLGKQQQQQAYRLLLLLVCITDTLDNRPAAAHLR